MTHIILAHGAWADGSSWSRVIPILQREGHRVTALQNPLTSLADDVANTRDVVARSAEPTLLVGHSYGGSVITAAAIGAPHVTALVYVAAFANDEGESGGAIAARFPQAPAGSHVRVDERSFMTLAPEHFHAVFAHDLDAEAAGVLAAVQKPTSVACFGDVLQGRPAWRSLPSFYSGLGRRPDRARGSPARHREADRREDARSPGEPRLSDLASARGRRDHPRSGAARAGARHERLGETHSP